MPDDGIVYAFKGTVKSMTSYYPAKDAESQSFQVVTLLAGGKEIKATVRNREEFPKEWKGKPIYLLSHQGNKGWSGVKAKDNDYKGKTERVLWVTASAEVVPAAEYEADGQGASEAKDNQPQEQRRPTGQPARRAATNSAPAGDRANPSYEVEEGIKQTKRLLWKSHNLMRMVSRLVEYDNECYKEDYGKEYTVAEMQSLRATHYITARDALSMLPGEAMVFPPTKWAKEQALKENGAPDAEATQSRIPSSDPEPEPEQPVKQGDEIEVPF